MLGAKAFWVVFQIFFFFLKELRKKNQIKGWNSEGQTKLENLISTRYKIREQWAKMSFKCDLSTLSFSCECSWCVFNISKLGVQLMCIKSKLGCSWCVLKVNGEGVQLMRACLDVHSTRARAASWLVRADVLCMWTSICPYKTDQRPYKNESNVWDQF